MEHMTSARKISVKELLENPEKYQKKFKEEREEFWKDQKTSHFIHPYDRTWVEDVKFDEEMNKLR